MKQNNPYATNRAGKIDAPKKQQQSNRSTVTSGNDLRCGRKQKGKD